MHPLVCLKDNVVKATCSRKKRYRLECTSHKRGAKKVHRYQIALEALVSTYYRKKGGKGEKAVENLTFYGESSLR